jgi:hypothetical protein
MGHQDLKEEKKSFGNIPKLEIVSGAARFDFAQYEPLPF